MSDNPVLTIGPPLRYIEIDGGSLYLGRDSILAMTVPALMSKVVSNRHCAIRREADDRWMLEDLGSTNGTWMRSTRLFGKVLLHTGDVFTLGRNGPVCECYKGFGGLGPDATNPEDQLAGNVFVDPGTSTIVDGRDGSAEKPYKVGRTPEITLIHERSGRELSAKGYTIVIGRDPESAQIVIRSDEERHVSGRHCEVRFRSDGAVVVRDLESRNGTWHNGKPLREEQPLREGDRLVIGAAATTVRVVKLVTP